MIASIVKAQIHWDFFYMFKMTTPLSISLLEIIYFLTCLSFIYIRDGVRTPFS